jgi:hypothetical protein
MSFRTQLAASETQIGYVDGGTENVPAEGIGTAISRDQDQNSRLKSQILKELTGREFADVAIGFPGADTGTRNLVNLTGMHGQQRAVQNRVDLIPNMPTISDTRRPIFIALQEWEGIVIERKGDSFVARLHDLSDKQRIGEEEATFPVKEVSDDDLELLKIGAVFRWTIGFQKLGATKQRISQLVFRRLPQWTKRDIREADDLAARLARAFATTENS